MNFIVVGASAGLGRALAEQLAEDKHGLLLVASGASDLAALASDFHLRHSVQVEYAALRVGCSQSSIDEIVNASKKLGKIDGVLFPLGYSRSDDDGTLGPDAIERIIGSNLTGTMAICSHFLPLMLEENSGHIVFFGSVAAERGRSSNVVYASAKRGLQSFYESIRHRCANSQINVQYYQLGYLNTAQTYGKKLPFPAAEPKDAAKFIVKNLKKGSGLTYYPWFWVFICLALRCTPWMVFKKLKF